MLRLEPFLASAVLRLENVQLDANVLKSRVLGVDGGLLLFKLFLELGNLSGSGLIFCWFLVLGLFDLRLLGLGLFDLLLFSLGLFDLRRLDLGLFWLTFFDCLGFFSWFSVGRGWDISLRLGF